MTLWRAADAAAATGGRATGDWSATGVSIDTRTLAPGDLFVALSAARDGHEFVAQALDRGAAAALVSRIPDGVDPDRLLVVGDVLDGLWALGRAGRARTGAKVAAITGSVGKTSTKEMLRAMLAPAGRVHAAQASYNNHWGVPLTLARMPPDAEFAVIEIGMSAPGEIAPLSRLARPHVAMLTTVAAAHLEAFEDLSGIAREKASIVDGLEEGGLAILNVDHNEVPAMIARAGDRRIRTFGACDMADWHLCHLRPGPETTEVDGRHGTDLFSFAVHAPGAHLAMNALGALGVADALGVAPATAIAGLADWRPAAGRGVREALDVDGARIVLIDDAFNANPASMSAALGVLARTPTRGRRVAILGDMLELGAQEGALHAAIADDPAAASIDLFHLAGPRMTHLAAALPEAKRGRVAADADGLAAGVRALVADGDVVLVKGSKSSRIARVVDALRAIGHPAPRPD
ncbi:MAG: UDP-N-acetylmuramoyl-tripeptide--D-alanyl-D-alanine ligase [Paracoccaceae bacterium]